MKQFFLLLLISCVLYATEVELEVLGSGGPEIDGRASTSYLIYIDKKARLIVDMGSGSMLRYEQSEAKLQDLEAVVLTHLHIDHSVDLPAFMKAGFFSSRKNSLDIIAPDGNKFFPSTSEFLENLFGKNGAYRYMNDILTSASDSFQIIPIDIKAASIREYTDFMLTLLPVHHGIVPALALRIDIGDKSIIISGDTNDADKTLSRLAINADLFIAHHAVAQSASIYVTHLHMKPSRIAHIAKSAHVKKVLLTHRMRRTLGLEKKTKELINSIYKGEVVFAEDRMKIKI
ncbi:MBL fold metallo-hydrolase [Sulfurimonas sp. SAG-AH-194-L11]|nr:MBL fold metallo-hydrolase [Sulfurimonas sp. SAG-AH-194-L11]MDF1877717.1 MBL fold metallo-hydrolase [Sulfurimonas sp. SAG-AH-194-L11]